MWKYKRNKKVRRRDLFSQSQLLLKRLLTIPVKVASAERPSSTRNLFTKLRTFSRSQWPRGLRRMSASARLLRLWVRIPQGAWMFVCCQVEVSATGWSLVRGVLLTVVHRCVWSRNFVNEEAMAGAVAPKTNKRTFDRRLVGSAFHYHCYQLKTNCEKKLICQLHSKIVRKIL